MYVKWHVLEEKGVLQNVQTEGNGNLSMMNLLEFLSKHLVDK